ncbi:T9SS type B sorting domain-containing protein [Chitinophaga sp. G-6-1-13]|uniref:T9SS type B sorting domain-containing protein n=1 Tax=Chitinophaga fulva TaxID=2728842 RepID=A0A848GY53_9BACT|nr:gliding motility-associated C-terminal domain-containing protein [Chitinophaga fulva]NML41533.1 T9SS type B sorting domain-containing protein [Chitinophaga fulva]
MKALPLRYLSLLALLLSVFCRCYSQDKLYVVNGYELGYVDMADYTYKKMVTLPTIFTDLAITPDGKFYAIYGGSLYEVNPVTGACTPVLINPSFGLGNSMVSDRNGNLFVAGNGNMLYKIDLKAGAASFVGNMIASPGGDLCFSDGKLYMVTISNTLVEITLSTDRNSIVSQREAGRLNVRGSVYSIGSNQYGICYLISTAKELALIDLEDATTYVISNIKGDMGDVWGIAMEGEGGNDRDIEICGNGIDDDHNGHTDGDDMACRLSRGTCNSESREIFREDFGVGNGFGDPLQELGNGAYKFSTTAPLQEGYYTIVSDPQLAQGNSTWKQMTDHSGKPGGRMMVVNGSFLPGEFYRKKITGLCGGLQYALAVSACSVISPAVSCGPNTTPVPSRIRFRIEDENGNTLGQLSERYIPADPDPQGRWKDYGMIFTLPENVQNIQIVLLNDAPGGCGNDLAIDDILLSTCKPVLPVKINGNNSPAAACIGSTVSLTADRTGISLNNPVFSWQKLDEADGQWKDIPNARGEVFILSDLTSADTGQFRVQIKENNSGPCMKEAVSAVVVLRPKAPPVMTVTDAIKVCNGKPLIMQASTTATLAKATWESPNGARYDGLNAQVTNTATAQNEGKYVLTATNTDGCTSTAHTQVIIQEVTDPGTISFKDNACPGESLKIEVKDYSGDTIQWQIAGSPHIQGTQDKLVAIWNKPGVYPVKYSVISACGPVEVTVPRPAVVRELPTVDLGSDTLICRGLQLMLHPRYSSDVTTFSWQDGPFNTETHFTTSGPGVYKITVKNEWGCKASDNVNIQEKYCGCDVYLPTAFSPNGDGKNDIFKPVLYCVTKKFRFRVYNRWGQLIFSTTNPGEGWNGTLPGGNKAGIGSYIWTLEYESFDFPDVIKKTGAVTVVL